MDERLSNRDPDILLPQELRTDKDILKCLFLTMCEWRLPSSVSNQIDPRKLLNGWWRRNVAGGCLTNVSGHEETGTG